MACLKTLPRYASGVALVNVVVWRARQHRPGCVVPASLTQTPDLSIADELEDLAVEHPARNARTEVRTASINPMRHLRCGRRVPASHLLSHTLVRPNELNLEGLFGTLANVGWTNHGPVLCRRVPEAGDWSASWAT